MNKYEEIVHRFGLQDLELIDSVTNDPDFQAEIDKIFGADELFKLLDEYQLKLIRKEYDK